MKQIILTITILLCLASIAQSAQAAERVTVIRVTGIYLTPDSTSPKLGDVERGRELFILETSRDWLHVEANLTEESTVTGWIPDKGAVRMTTPDGDKIIFGEAADSEDQASQRHGRKGAADDAMRLYYRVYDYFPKSPLAGEALYRSADIRWQIEKEDVMSRPSAHQEEPFLREGMNEERMKEVTKKFPGTKWADLAAFHLIENKLCGDWAGKSKCPEREAELYEKYANERPQSPAAAESLYDAAWRRASLIEIYKNEDESKKVEESKGKALALAQKLVGQYPQSDWAARGRRLLFYVQQGMPVYGSVNQ